MEASLAFKEDSWQTRIVNILHRHRPSNLTSLERNQGNSSRDLLQSEYVSLRAESVQSFASAQSIIQWSLATYGVLFGAALVVLSRQSDPSYKTFHDIAVLVIFTVLLPGLMCAATWQWLGEITRMERVGMYLRGLERYLARQGQNGQSLSEGDQLSPLNWETFLNSESGARKRNAPYVGTAAMFAGAFLSSLLLAGFWQFHLFAGSWWHFPFIFWPITGILFVAVFFFVSLMLGRSVTLMGNERYNFDTQQVEKIKQKSAKYKTTKQDGGK
jgi:hypothetical protein